MSEQDFVDRIDKLMSVDGPLLPNGRGPITTLLHDIRSHFATQAERAQGEAQALAHLIEAADFLWLGLRDGFVRCQRCGDQETTNDMDGVQDFGRALDAYNALVGPARCRECGHALHRFNKDGICNEPMGGGSYVCRCDASPPPTAAPAEQPAAEEWPLRADGVRGEVCRVHGWCGLQPCPCSDTAPAEDGAERLVERIDAVREQARRGPLSDYGELYDLLGDCRAALLRSGETADATEVSTLPAPEANAASDVWLVKETEACLRAFDTDHGQPGDDFSWIRGAPALLRRWLAAHPRAASTREQGEG